MSIAGARSSIGDNYQTLNAVPWAVRMLHDSDISYIEIDSTSLDPAGAPIAVDDFVIHFNDGKTTYAQCKKNEKDCEAWKFADLKAELQKTGRLLANDPKGEVIFYSRNNFGKLQKLAEHASAYFDNAAFLQSLSFQGAVKPGEKAKLSEHEETLAQLAEIWQANLAHAGCEVLQFLHRITFETTPNFDRLRERELGLLRLHVTQAETVFDAIKTRINGIACRHTPTSAPTEIALAHSLRREDLLNLIAEKGACLTPSRNEAQLQQAFQQASSIGRTWRRQIAGKKLPRLALEELKAAIDTKPKTVLITDAPGSGKTCLLLDLVEALETSPIHACLFIQAREFAGCKTEQERIANGFLEDICGSVARMAEFRHTVVIIDSLDVLSISQDHRSLSFFLGLIDRLQLCTNVSVLAACRSFDLQYDCQLKERHWDKRIVLGPLDWEREVLPLLQIWGVQQESLSLALKQLLLTPRLLDLFIEIIKRGEVTAAASAQELSKHYLRTVVEKKSALGSAAMAQLERISQIMLKQRQLDLPLSRANLPEEMCALLLSEGVLTQTSLGKLSFGHQTLLDVLAVQGAERDGEKLLGFILRHPATPFVRPSIRAFFFQLRLNDVKGFRSQFRAVLAAPNVAFHIKRLLCESLAETAPEEDDWGLLNLLFREYLALFNTFYWPARRSDWFALLSENWLPILIEERDKKHFMQYAQSVSGTKNEKREATIALWQTAFGFSWLDQSELIFSIQRALHDCKEWRTLGMPQLLQHLSVSPHHDIDFIGDILAKWVEATNSGDDVLWHHITAEVQATIAHGMKLRRQLRCTQNHFRDEQFLPRRMQQSEILLNLAIDAALTWGRQIATNFCQAEGWCWNLRRERGEVQDNALEALLSAIETAVLAHAAAYDEWWQKRGRSLGCCREAVLSEMALLAFVADPERHIPEIKALILDRSLLEAHHGKDLLQLVNAIVPHLDEDAFDILQSHIGSLYQDSDNADQGQAKSVVIARSELIGAIPANYRPLKMQQELDATHQRFGQNALRSNDHAVQFASAPIYYDGILQLSELELLRLLRHYSKSNEKDHEFLPSGKLVGGAIGVASQLAEAASRSPERYFNLLQKLDTQISDHFRTALLDGVARYLHYRIGESSPNGTQWLPIVEPDTQRLAQAIFDELEQNFTFWRIQRDTTGILQACAFVVEDDVLAEKVLRLQIDCESTIQDEEKISDSKDLVFIGINSLRGRCAETCMILAQRWAKENKPLPVLLSAELKRFASLPDAAVRALILRRLPTLQASLPDFGWSLFELAVQNDEDEVWKYAERCLYCAYHANFQHVSPYLDFLAQNLTEMRATIWGRISALACLSQHINLPALQAKLAAMGNAICWQAAATVFAANAHHRQHQALCFEWLSAATLQTPYRLAIAGEMKGLFRKEKMAGEIPAPILQAYFEYCASHEQKRFSYGFATWLVTRAKNYPEQALQAIEIALGMGDAIKIEAHDNNYCKLLTRLFREGEELEMSDDGDFLTRAIRVQDALLERETYMLDQWLMDAEGR